MASTLLPILYNLLIVAAIWTGALFSFFVPMAHAQIRSVISFSAGVFLGVAFLHMIPESIEMLGPSAGIYIMAGYVFFYVLERFVMTHPCEEDHCNYHTIGIAAFLGLALHSLLNGLALGSSLLVPGLGFTVFIATLIHKAPESFSLASLLALGKQPRSTVIKYVGLLSLMVPLGTALAQVGLTPFGEKAIGIALSASAGMFLHIATGDLLPETHVSGKTRWYGLASFGAGIGLAILTRMVGHH